ncbi:peptidase S9 [Pedobacter psychrophilus]|uniref:Peptidase S9 n=1 Tax=Pedobacter psychrophilus TaxID=1826909 RepID=A0A179DID9_9SPHI|nr:S9 family peptidase [Pedobacter psychrophilus]OAQ40805.1 peptidase S9 [Pedobacter psychrophilus]
MKKILVYSLLLFTTPIFAQKNLTPEMLWKLGRVSGETISADKKSVIYGVSNFELASNKSERNLYSIPLLGGASKQITNSLGSESVVKVDEKTGRATYSYKGQLWEMNADGTGAKQLTNFKDGLENVRISPDGKYILYTKDVAIVKNIASDKYKDLPKSDAYVYEDLNYRHWDTWEDGKFSHVFFAAYENGKIGTETDIMKDEPYDCPQKPSGGLEDVIWSPDSKSIVYVTKKKYGKDYAQSTNTDIFRYEIGHQITVNLTDGMVGYDTQPAYNYDGSRLAWTSMAEDGYETDKNDIRIYDYKLNQCYNLTKDWDETVNSFVWSADKSKIYFLAVKDGTEQIFEISLGNDLSQTTGKNIKMLTSGRWDINGIVGQVGNTMVVSRTDMNHSAELFKVDLKTGTLTELTTVNKAAYADIAMSEVEAKTIKTTDGKDMLTWVIYPPGFDPAKKYPTLLYCQGGPQSALSQFYSVRWNFQLMAAQGYIVVAPNRRGMPGHGVEWNKEISGDWGGQAIKDYLSAIDALAKEPYVDKDRLGCVGASYGGYSVYMLAGIHENRFKTFIAHDGLFDLRSWYGTTEELFFANHDIGGPFWAANAPKSYQDFNPVNFVNKWNTPIMIVQGGRDYRVPVEQGLEAFQAAQLQGIKSKLLYLTEENHWVLSGQNGIVWQREFFSWLKETL